MKEKSFVRYIIELMIVIAGVTIAFWLNTRAEEAKEQKTLKNYYGELVSDLERDRKFLEVTIRANTRKQEDMITMIRMYQQGTPPRDSVFKYAEKVGSYTFFDPRDVTYRSMISSGDLKLIQDLAIKRRLISLYDRYQFIAEFEANHLDALDQNYFPQYVQMVDYLSGKPVAPLEESLLIKNYFGFSANELTTHLKFYASTMRMNQALDSLLQDEL